MPQRGTFGTYVKIDPAALATFMRSPQGPVFRRLLVDGEFVKDEAKRRVGVYRPTPGDRRQRRPGTLRDSIVKRIADVDGSPAVIVGSEDPIALIHHEGSVPHPIVPRRAQWLVFWWGKVGKLVRFKRVNHPGTKPNRYLTEALAALRGRY